MLRRCIFVSIKRGLISSYIVYNSTMKKDTLVKLVYELGSTDITVKQLTSNYLKDKITEAFQIANDLPWPRTDNFLRNVIFS